MMDTKLNKRIATTATLMVAAATAGTAWADVLVLNPPTTDGFIRATQQDGSAMTGLNLIGDTTNANDFLRGVYAFDLSAPELVGATINSVTLTLTIEKADTGGSANVTSTIDLHQLNAGISNATTWDNIDSTVPTPWTSAGGDFGGVLASTSGNASTVVGGDTFNFSSAGLVAATAGAIGGELNLLGKLSIEDASARDIFRFYSSESSNIPAARRPTLTIDYTPVPEPGSLALLGLGGLCVLRRRRG